MTGHHVIADLRSATRLTDAGHIEACLVAAAAAAGATLLEVRLHSFGPGQGVTGVALLAESHISIHTWPEYGTACVDIFMCGRENDLDAGLEAIVTGLAGEIVRCSVVERYFGEQATGDAHLAIGTCSSPAGVSDQRLTSSFRARA